MTQHCTITGTMLVLVHYIVCTLKIVFFPEITVFVVVKINSLQCCGELGGGGGGRGSGPLNWLTCCKPEVNLIKCKNFEVANKHNVVFEVIDGQAIQ